MRVKAAAAAKAAKIAAAASEKAKASPTDENAQTSKAKAEAAANAAAIASTQPVKRKVKPYTKCKKSGTKTLIGYWYAGAVSPGGVGSVVKPGQWTHVRKGYAQAGNSFNKKTTSVCVLRPWSRVKISAPAIKIGKYYYQPLYSTDILK